MAVLERQHSDKKALAEHAARARLAVLETVAFSKAGHIGGPLSAMDMLVSLYFDRMRINPQDPQNIDRDRFILSKGHSGIALYAVLALRGYFPVEELKTFDQGDSRIQAHPDMRLTPGIDASTGSLGQGLSAGLGMAVGAKRLGKDFHTWVMVGDGEMGEGMNWEAILSAPRFGVDNLTLIIDVNGLQQYGWPQGEKDRFDRSEPLGHVNLPQVFTGFGWHVIDIDGHNLDEIRAALEEAEDRRATTGVPSVILSRTTKGNGVSWTAGTYKWHNGVPTDEQLQLARQELIGAEAVGGVK
jgi:transketolase